MKRVFCFLLPILIATNVYPNDTIIEKFSGGNEYIIHNNNDISIESEILVVDLNEDNYHVSIDYIFRNDGNDVNLELGFPEVEEIAYIHQKKNINEKGISNFKTSVNGVDKEIYIETAFIKINKYEAIHTFYKKEVFFPGKSKTKVHVEYDTKYIKSYGNLKAEYLLGTAICWKKIEKLNVIINLNTSKYFIFNYEILKNLPIDNNVSRENENRALHLLYENILLDFNTKLSIVIDDGDGIFGLSWDYDFENYVFSRSEFEMLTKEQLRLSRNLIYAYHGYSFKNKELTDLYKRYDFYKVNPNFSEKLFNENEIKNLEIILELEK